MRFAALALVVAACHHPAGHDVDGGVDFNAPDAAIDARNACENIANVLLAPRVDFATGTSPFGIAVADFNGDHLPDLAIATQQPGGATVLLGMAPGCAAAFQPGVDFPTEGNVHAVAAADLDGDGRPDVAAVSQLLDVVSVLLDTTPAAGTTPTFAAPVDFATATNPSAVAVGDVSGDGKPDLVTCAPDGISVLVNTSAAGAASFAEKLDLPHTGATFGVALADFNSDGKLDIAVTDSDADTVSVYLNISAGALAFAAPMTFGTGGSPFALAVADLDGDERPDIVVTDIATDTISILANTTPIGAASASFSPHVDLPTGARPYAVAIGDLNRDGHADIAVAAETPGAVSLHLASGTSYAPHLDVATLGAPHGVAIADLDGDTAPDLVVSSADADMVSVLLAR